MKIICFGGSFNPIHYGHLVSARAVAEEQRFERVMVIPSAQPPHKPNAVDLAPAHHRLAMCRLAVEGDPLFEVSDIELTRTGPSYTIDTARQLKRRGWDEIHWLIGADMVQILPKWHEPDNLLNELTFWLVARPGWTIDWSMIPAKYHHLAERIVQVPQVQLSATLLRQRVAAGRSIAYLTPPAVCQYVREQRLYLADAVASLPYLQEEESS